MRIARDPYLKHVDFEFHVFIAAAHIKDAAASRNNSVLKGK